MNATTAQQSQVQDLYAGLLPVFSKAPAAIEEDTSEVISPLFLDRAAWESKLISYSSIFEDNPLFIDGVATLSFRVERHRFASSEGSILAHNRYSYILTVTGYVQADDGMKLDLTTSFFARSLTDLPSDSLIFNSLHELKSNLLSLRNAPVVDSYIGPAILSGEAAAVFFHEIVGHRLEGSSQRFRSDAGTFSLKVGEKVFPEWLSLMDDPTLSDYNGNVLAGYYTYDEEGVKAIPVVLAEDGVLKGFLTTRIPLPGFPFSNGHARSQIDLMPISRQSNLIVSARGSVSEQMLRQQLLEELKVQGKEYGYYVRNVSGGLTQTLTFSINAFSVKPTLLYRVYADGRPDQLVRGASFIGTPLNTLTGILAAGSSIGIFNGFCKASSGVIPVSAVSPTLLVRYVEMQCSSRSSGKPVLSRP